MILSTCMRLSNEYGISTVTSGGNIGNCGRLSQPSWLLGAL